MPSRQELLTLDMSESGRSRLFNFGYAPAFQKWTRPVTREPVRNRIRKLLTNIVTLKKYATDYPWSGAATLLDTVGMDGPFQFVPRRRHKELLAIAVESIGNMAETGDAVTAHATQVVHGPKGIGKSFLMKLIVLGSSLCLPDDTKFRVIAGYVSSPVFRGGHRKDVQDIRDELLRQHGVPRDSHKIRPVVIIDEFDQLYHEPREYVTDYLGSIRQLREGGARGMVWITGSAGALRMLVYGVAPADTSQYEGYTKANHLQGDKFLLFQLDNRLRFYQSLLLLVNAEPKRRRVGEVREFVTEVEHYLDAHMEELKLENATEDQGFRIKLGDDHTSAWDPALDLTLVDLLDVRSPTPATEVLDEARVCQIAHTIFWNSCGLARHYEALTTLNQEASGLQKLRQDMGVGGDKDLRYFLHSLATVFAEEVPSVLDPLQAFSDEGFKAVSVGDVFDAASPKDREVPQEKLVRWADLPYLYLNCESSGDTWQVGFRHPRYAAEANALATQELQGISQWNRMSLYFPLGHLGQGFPETMALKAMAEGGGIRRAIQSAAGRGARRSEFNLPEDLSFNFVPDVRFDLAKPSEWDRTVVNRIMNGEAIAVATRRGQRGVDGVAFKLWETEHGETYLHIWLIEVKLACLFDTDTFERTDEHRTVDIDVVRQGLHLAWLEWGAEICGELRWPHERTVPWFILETCKRVEEKQAWSELLAGNPPPEPELEPEAEGEEENITGSSRSDPSWNPSDSKSTTGSTGRATRASARVSPRSVASASPERLTRAASQSSGEGYARSRARASGGMCYDLRPLRAVARIIPLDSEELEKREITEAVARIGRDTVEIWQGDQGAAGAFCSFGCVLDQEDLYDCWPKGIQKLAELLDLAPEYTPRKERGPGSRRALANMHVSSEASAISGSRQTSPRAGSRSDGSRPAKRQKLLNSS